MRTWIISANSEDYNHRASFESRGFIDWAQDKRKYAVGDIVFIYNNRVSYPPQVLRYKTVIEKKDMHFSEIVDDKEYWLKLSKYQKGKENDRYFRLRLVEIISEEGLDYHSLRAHGLTTTLQNPFEVNEELLEYINSILGMDETLPFIDDDVIDTDKEDAVFPETDMLDEAYEGAKKQVFVNKYERSAESRRKCIEYHGCRCAVCGMDFGEVYGDIGEGFIHVHHKVPLYKINKEYKVNYKTDLVPVCPNCHAMLHRSSDGKYLSVEELQIMMKYSDIDIDASEVVFEDD